MIQVNTLKVNFLYPREFDQHNHDLVGYVVQKYPHKVIKGAILTRASAEDWYTEQVAQYPAGRYTILIGTVSLVGVVDGLQAVSQDEKEKSASTYDRRSKDPSAN